jgi:hypothetical protein
MDIASLKLQLVQNILKIDNIDDLNTLDETISYYLNTKEKRLTYQELQNRIAKSESDFENNQFKESDELIKKYKNLSMDG